MTKPVMKNGILRRETKKGNRYLVRLYRGRDSQGKKQYAFRTFLTHKAAHRWQTEQRNAVQTGTFLEPSQQALGGYLPEWLDGPAKMTVRPRTLEGYQALVERYVEQDDLAKIPLARLTTVALEQFYARLSANKLSPRTVRIVHAILRSALAKAARDRLIAANPAVGAPCPANSVARCMRSIAGSWAGSWPRARPRTIGGTRFGIYWRTVGCVPRKRSASSGPMSARIVCT